MPAGRWYLLNGKREGVSLHTGGGGVFHFKGALGDAGQQSRQRALVLKCMSTVTKIGALGKMYGYSPEKKALMGKCTGTI